MAAVEVIVVDKSVSTEDLGIVNRDIHLEVARLEAMLNTLVENKVESMKADKEKEEKEREKEKEKNGKHRITSTSTTASSTHGQRRHRHHHKSHTHRHDASPRRKRHKTCCDHELGVNVGVPIHGALSEDDDELMDEAFDFLTYQEQREPPAYPCTCPCPCNCSCPTTCQDNHHGQIMKLPYDDFISISMDPELVDPELGDVEDDGAVMLDSRRRRRRRRRRKRRRRQRLAAAAAVSAAAAAQARRDARKVMDTDDLPQRARWTIVVTACLLLLMCLLLVGVTLRMAPIIDDMVRKENEELMNSLNRESSSWNHSATTTTPAPAVAALGTGK